MPLITKGTVPAGVLTVVDKLVNPPRVGRGTLNIRLQPIMLPESGAKLSYTYNDHIPLSELPDSPLKLDSADVFAYDGDPATSGKAAGGPLVPLGPFPFAPE